jgi:hypothetical protein
MMFKDKPSILKAFFSLIVLEGVLALAALALIPSDSRNALVFGFSASRIALIGVVKVILLFALGALVWASTSRARMERAVEFSTRFFCDEKKRRVFILTSGLIALLGILFLLMPAERIGAAIYQRVVPLFVLGTLISLQALALQFVWRGEKIRWENLSSARQVWVASGIALAFFIAAWVYIAWTGVGIAPQPSGWLPPGTPILFQQVLLAWLLGLALLSFGKQLDRYKRADVLIALLVWVAAAVVWQMEPMLRHSYFNPKPTPPNFEYYPYSDAILHDAFAQNILIGSSKYLDAISSVRPLYSIFLAVLHLFLGQRLETLIVAQVVVLAITPALMYLLGTRLGGRGAGIFAAVLVILREKNSIAATNFIEVSHSKLLMSDLPTMTMLVAFVFFLVAWFQDKENKLYLGALAGAFLGMAILVRSQAQLIIPVAVLAIVLGKKDGWKSILKKSLVFIFGVLVVIAPWVWRNYQTLGRAVVEWRFTLIGSYAASAEEVQMLPGETQKEYDSRMMQLIIKAALTRPEEIVPKWLSYFIHNEILSVTYLPMDLKFKDLPTYMEDAQLWSNPKDSLPARTLPVFFFTLCVIAVGLGVSYRRAGWIGIAPLIFHFVYNFTVTLIFASGWRFILPVDWVSLLYFSIGLAQISVALGSLFTRNDSSQPAFNFEYTPIARNKTVITLVLLAMFGVSFPIFERSFPEQYLERDARILVQKYIPDGFSVDENSALSALNVESFLANESGAVAIHGRALYPSYYKQGQFWGDSIYLGESKQYDRLEFMLIGANGASVYLPSAPAPEYFPHASTVFVIGCQSPNAIRALAVKVNDEFILTSPWNGLTCEIR